MIEAGTVLQNRYLIERQIGQGGMGTVYIATDQRFGSTVAVKETIFTDQNLRKAFEREAQLLNSLRHPALPRVSDHFIEGDGQFIVMEYIAGDDLFDMVARDGAFAVADVLKWAEQLLDALNYLHTQKTPVVHRDIKPQNLKLTSRGDIVLLDFGLAKGSASELSQLTMAKSVFGYSRSYAPLEQIQGTGTDPRSDLYSLAATLYHLLTGKPPIDALTRATAVLSADADPLPPVHYLNPKVPASVAQVLHQAMALNPKARPGSSAQMRYALTEAAAQPAEEQSFTGIEAFPVAAEVFTQNTQLMNQGEAEAGKTAAIRSVSDTNLEKVSTDPNPEVKGTGFDDATKTRHRGMIVNVPKPEPRGVVAPVPRRSYASTIGIAAAVIVLLGGLGFAFFNANMMRSTSDAPAVPQNDALPAEKQNFVEPAAPSEPVKPAEVVPDAPIAQANSANEAPVVNNKTPKTVAENQPERNVPNNDRTAQVAQKPNQPKTGVWTIEGVEMDLEDIEELKNLNKTIKKELKDVKVYRDVLKSIPPEFRSNDPQNPVDQEKLKIYLKKHQDMKRQQMREEMRRAQEENRKRREQGIPPFEHPNVPRAPKVLVMPPPAKAPTVKQTNPVPSPQP